MDPKIAYVLSLMTPSCSAALLHFVLKINDKLMFVICFSISMYESHTDYENSSCRMILFLALKTKMFFKKNVIKICEKII